jgi:SpoVK/Ycf46/Vps4 family AAA+-type ATPase
VLQIGLISLMVRVSAKIAFLHVGFADKLASSTCAAALLRPGRFDEIIAVPPPDLIARIAILRIYSSRSPSLSLLHTFASLATRLRIFMANSLQDAA